MDHIERRNLAETAFRHALANDLGDAAIVVDRIASNSTPIQMYAVCCAFASAGADALRRQYSARDQAPVDFMYINPEPDNTAASPARAFARRFIVAFANRDNDMAKALFLVALEAPGDGFEHSVAALLTEAASMHAEVCKAHER
jgi:hypothetical protein